MYKIEINFEQKIEQVKLNKKICFLLSKTKISISWTVIFFESSGIKVISEPKIETPHVTKTMESF